jgi:hypothetical protein
VTILVDGIQQYESGEWCHMWSEQGDADELHAFAQKIGLRREWAQVSKGGRIAPNWLHYDLRPRKRVLAVKHGAVEMALLDWLREKQIEQQGIDSLRNAHEAVVLVTDEGNMGIAHVSPDIQPETVEALKRLIDLAHKAIERGEIVDGEQ